MESIPLIVLTIWLLPAAWFDYRSRRVPNWLTLPPLPVALWWAWGHGTLGLTLTVLAAGYIAFRFGGLGGADGKIATVVAAVSPPALALLEEILPWYPMVSFRLPRYFSPKFAMRLTILNK